MLIGSLLLDHTSDPADSKSWPKEKWDALVKYDPEISAAAEKLRPYGRAWTDKLGRDYFALQEDRKYLPSIVDRLFEEAEEWLEREEAQRWASSFVRTARGELCTEASRNILRKAERCGYVVTVGNGKPIAATKKGVGTSYLHSNADIERFGQYL
jgi:hypothetical protein